MATEQEMMVDLEAADKAGDTQLAQHIAGLIKAQRVKPPSSNTDVALNAANKSIAGLPDMILNAPNNLLNLGRAWLGAGRAAAAPAMLAVGKEPLPMPDLVPNPDLARRGMEAVGAINPAIQPQGFVQKAIDYGTQGAVGGALTGGAGLARSAVGAGMGAMSGLAAGGTQEATGNPALAATAGMLPGGMAGAMASAPRPTLSPNVQLLNSEGVQLTPGQMIGGRLKRIEDAATSFPLVGDTIKNAQRRGIESFGSAAINRSLEPIGEKLPAGLSGNKAVEYARQKLGDAYDNLLPKLKGDLDSTPGTKTLPAQAGQAAPPSFRQELDSIKAMGKAGLPEAQSNQLNRIIENEVIKRFTPQGIASGETLKNIESKLGELSKVMGRSSDYDVRSLGDALKETRAAMRRMINDVNPTYEGELSKINEGYSNFKRVQNAAASVGAPEGVFTPAQLSRAVRAGDISKDKARFAEGNANMQDLSAAAKSVLPSSIPDSGTPFRSMLAYSLAHPLRAVGLGVPLAAATLPYTGIGQNMAQGLLAGYSGNTPMGLLAQQTSPIVTGGTLADILRNQQSR